MKSWQIPRRTFLKGVGASILLPTLDVMIPTSAHAESAIGPRFAVMYMPTGIYGQGCDMTRNDKRRYFITRPWNADGAGAWRPTTTGPFKGPLPPVLGPLEALRDKVTIVSGLCSLKDNKPTGIQHSVAVANWLTAGWDKIIKGAANSPPNSVDQVIADSLGFTAGSSIVFNPNHSGGQIGGNESNGGYQAAVSFNEKIPGNHLVPQSKNPKEVFDRLFGNCKPMKTPQGPTPEQVTDKKILDRVLASIKDVKKKLGKDDSVRLEAFLQHIEDLEKKVTKVEEQTKQCPDDLEIAGEDWFSRVSAMVDVVALALATDAMPVATLMQGTEAKNNYYSEFISKYGDFIGIDGKKVTFASKSTDAHFDVAHSSGAGYGDRGIRAIEQYIAYTRMQMLFTKRLVEKLDSMPVEPNGLTPLDNSIILTGTCHSDGQTHNVHNIPTILSGGKKYGLNQGQHVAFPNQTDRGDFFYTLLRAMGVDVNDFNGHNKILSGIFG